MFSFPQIIAQALFPPLCLHCQREGDWLCPIARRQLSNLTPLIDPLTIKGVDRVWCAGSYDHPLVARLVTGMKYHGWTAYRDVLPQFFRAGHVHIEPAAVIPVPLHSQRQRWRGFNQAEFVAKAVAEVGGHRWQPLLSRQRRTKAQAHLGEAERRANVDGAFRLASGVENVPSRGILVDDVITTGRTIQECASVLRQAGMKYIIAVAIAKG